MKKILLAAVLAAFFVSTTADARGGRGFSGGRSFSRPAPARTYAPKEALQNPASISARQDF